MIINYKCRQYAKLYLDKLPTLLEALQILKKTLLKLNFQCNFKCFLTPFKFPITLLNGSEAVSRQQLAKIEFHSV